MRSKGKTQQRSEFGGKQFEGPASLLALEPRMMFDGAAVTTAINALTPLMVDEHIYMADQPLQGNGFTDRSSGCRAVGTSLRDPHFSVLGLFSNRTAHCRRSQLFRLEFGLVVQF